MEAWIAICILSVVSLMSTLWMIYRERHWQIRTRSLKATVAAAIAVAEKAHAARRDAPITYPHTRQLRDSRAVSGETWTLGQSRDGYASADSAD